jgi:hypothetical protein
LETKFCPNRRIFVFWRQFWIQNGRHSKPKWSSYGAICLTPCKYPFPLKFLNFWIFNNLFLFFIFFYWRPFWKFYTTKSTTLSDDLFLCQVSKGSTERFPFNIFCTLVTMATAAIWIFFNPPPPPKAATHSGGYSYKVSWSLMKGIKKKKITPLFCFHGNCGKICPTNMVVSNHVNSDHVPSFSCLDVWTNRQVTSGVYAMTVTTSAYHSRKCGRL